MIIDKRYRIGSWLLLWALSISAQEGPLLSVYGNDDYQPLAFASVISLPDSNIQTITDAQGQLRLPENWEGDDQLLVSYLGYEDGQASRAELAASDYIITLGEQTGEWTNIAPVVIGRRKQLSRELSQSVQLLEESAIQLSMPANSADVLAEVGGVYVQKSQQGGGSPILRGFEANRILLVVDGVRMNNAIYRNGHLQNAITIDANALESIEVVSGPGSLEYGSDAVGGVVHFRTRQPDFQQGFSIQRLQVATQYGTAAKHRQLRLGFEASGSKFASLTLLSLNRFGDLRAGENRPKPFPNFGLRPFFVARINGQDSLVSNAAPNRQLFSGYDQLDILHKQRYDLGNSWEAQLNFQYSISSDIPRYDNLIEVRDGQLRWAEWDYGPQTRLLSSLRLENRNSSFFADYSSLIIARQSVQEDRRERRIDDPLRAISEVDVEQWTVQLDFDKSLKLGQRLGYGFDARTDIVEALAFWQDADRERAPYAGAATRYPSQGSRLSSIGGYADYRLKTPNQWTFGAGVRFNQQWLRAAFGVNDPVEWPATYLQGVENNQTSLTGTASIQKETPHSRWHLLWAQAFRAPNIDDWVKFRERNGRIQVPNLDLRPERSNSLEVAWNFSTYLPAVSRQASAQYGDVGPPPHWTIEAVAYFSWLQDAIIRTDFQLPDGSNFFLSRGDTLLVQANVNAERAQVYGFDLSINRTINQFWSFQTEAHWLRGRRFQAGPTGSLWLPQDHIPPAYGRSRLRYATGPFLAELNARYQLRKELEDYAVSEISLVGDGLIFDRSGTSDNLELTPIDPDTETYSGAYGWWTLGLNLEFRASEQWTFRLGFDNIFDRHYRTFGSGISAPGRDFRIGLSWRQAEE
ncbi:MAG: TonB-dependent receptor [Bacteroidota bacterium]